MIIYYINIKLINSIILFYFIKNYLSNKYLFIFYTSKKYSKKFTNLKKIK